MDKSVPDAHASGMDGRANLHILNDDPFNAETKGPALIAQFLTPQRDLYVRSHGEIPRLGDDHAIRVGRSLYTRADLIARFAARDVVATLQCAGNRRADLQAVARTSGDPWGVGAIGNARWSGVALIDLLEDAGCDVADGRHVLVDCADSVDVEGEVAPFGISIGIEKARCRDVLVAWAMNGEPLLPEHGAPLRLVVPGYAGVRSAKWITRIATGAAPSDAPIQARDYKYRPAWIDSAQADRGAGLTIEAMPVNAAICSHADGERVAAGTTTIAGYAIAYDRAVARVDVSIDGGATWRDAPLTRETDEPWSWTRWSCIVDLPPGNHALVVRAVDSAGQMQPEHARDVWNSAGYFAAMWHRVAIVAA